MHNFGYSHVYMFIGVHHVLRRGADDADSGAQAVALTDGNKHKHINT